MIKYVIGYVAFLLIAFLLRDNKNSSTKLNWLTVLYGIVFQIALVFAITNLPICITALESIANGVMKLKDSTLKGTEFVFGYIGGGAAPFEVKSQNNMFSLAFQALPTVILVGVLSAILTYLKILPLIAKIIGFIFKFVFRIKESIGLVSAAKIFLGQLEAPLLIKPQLPYISRSDMFIVLSLAFATTSAAVMPVYASAIQSVCPDAMKHIITSSVINVISVLILSSIIMPSSNSELNISAELENAESKPYPNFMGAMSKGLSDGMFVWWCIVGSLVGMVALITFVNYIFALFPDIGGSPITLQRICGIFMYPFAWLIGIQSQDLTAISQVLGEKLVLNEIIAFFDLAKSGVSHESVVKTIYAINNFGNFACIGITVGGLMAMAPSQKHIATLAWRAFITGLLATGLTSSLVNFF